MADKKVFLQNFIGFSMIHDLFFDRVRQGAADTDSTDEDLSFDDMGPAVNIIKAEARDIIG